MQQCGLALVTGIQLTGYMKDTRGTRPDLPLIQCRHDCRSDVRQLIHVGREKASCLYHVRSICSAFSLNPALSRSCSMAMDGEDWSFTQALQTAEEGSWQEPPEQQEMMQPPSVEMEPYGILLPTQEDALDPPDPFLEPSPSQPRSIVVEPVTTTSGLASSSPGSASERSTPVRRRLVEKINLLGSGLRRKRVHAPIRKQASKVTRALV